MFKIASILCLSTTLACSPALHAQVNQVSATGWITDTMCGKRGANALHIDHAKRAVASGKAQYALYDEATKKLYILDSGQGAGGGGQWEQWLGQRVRITGTLSASPIRSAGESYAPDAVATYKDSSGTVRGTSATSTDPSTATAASGQARVQQHAKALDTSTPVAGVLSVSSVELAPK